MEGWSSCEVVEPLFDGETWLGLLKDGIRIDWYGYAVRRGHILHFPGVRFPVGLFENLQEIDFLGERFLVPSPPEEYLRIKYGPAWMTPKQLDYGADVIANMPDGPIPGHPGRLMQRLLARVLPRRTTRIRVLDPLGAPVSDAAIAIAGWGTYRTNQAGYARFYRPAADVFALVIRGGAGRRCYTRSSSNPAKRTCTGQTQRRPQGASSS